MRAEKKTFYSLDSGEVNALSDDEFHAILRGADNLISSGGPTLLAKIQQSKDTRLVPLLKDWAKIDYKKIRERIKLVIKALQ